MAIITDSGGGRDVLRSSIGTSNNLTVVSASATEVVVRNVGTQVLTILTGTDLAPVMTPSGGLQWVTGTLTGFEMQGWDGSANQPGLTATGLSWDARVFVTAVRDYVVTGGESGIAALLSLQPVTWDAEDAVRGTDAGFSFVTSAMTLTGSAFGDTLQGGSGDHTILDGDGDHTILGGDGDDVIGSGGSIAGSLIDTGAGFDSFTTGYLTHNRVIVSHRSLGDRTAIVATSNFGELVIDKGSFGQTRSSELRSYAPLESDGGLFIEGTALDDRFDFTLNPPRYLGTAFVGLIPGRGSDTVTATGSGRIGLDFSTDTNGVAASEGARINLVTGQVANDGFGFADVLVLRGDIQVSVTLTAQADTLVVTKRSGVLRGGEGIDTLDYGQGAFTGGMLADLEKGSVRGGGSPDGGTFSGAWYIVEGFENLTGTIDHGDILIGGHGANVIAGLGGDDAILGDGFRAAYAPAEAAQVYRIFRAAFDRALDAVVLNGWTAELFTGNMDPHIVAGNYVQSAEFLNIYGALDNTAFVTQLYRTALDRDPDAAGLAHWVAKLETSYSQIGGHMAVLLGIAESREFVAKTLDEARGFVEARNEAGWSDDVFRLYQATLDRAPDEAGFLDWLGRLAGGQRFLSVVDGFVGSAEFRATYGALDDAEFVTQLYRNVLDRDPDAGGLADWLGKLGDGTLTRAEVVRGFVLSREFTAATADAVADFMRGVSGGDTLDGGAGDNRVWGGMLADDFVFDAGDDGQTRVMDFEVWDRLVFEGFGYDDTGDIRAHLAQTGADVVFEDQGVTVTLVNTQLAAIADDSLIFG